MGGQGNRHTGQGHPAHRQGTGRRRPRAMVYPGRRSSDYKDSTQIRRSYAIVNALLGNWDREGGLIVPKKIKDRIHSL
jgi:anaerobic selenocysteine-containing dehydrogenase